MSDTDCISAPTAEAVLWAEHLRKVADVLGDALRTGMAPPPVMVSISEDKITLTPWLLGLPVTACVAWSNFLDDLGRWSVVVHQPYTEEGRLLSSLWCVGKLAGISIEIIGSASYRGLPGVDPDVRGTHQPIDAKTVILAAAREHEDLDRR